MRRVSPPDIDPRTASLIYKRLRAMAPHYTREWAAKDDGDPGVALLKIFSFLAQGVVQRLNRAPERHFLSFLDMLGIRLLPKTPAVVPVRFLVAQGTTDSVLVRSGTQISAPATAEHTEELPFETTQDLQVVPAALSALFAVDPSRDVILKPSPGFLQFPVVPALPPEYRVEAFSSAGTRALQLDRVNQLEKGDFLRVQIGTAAAAEAADQCCSPVPMSSASALVADHLIVDDVKGNIVLVTDPLPRDYDVGTVVQKLVQFDLLNGRNFQEHILYLAHGDLFNVKSEAIFTLLFTHAAGTGSNLDPLRIAWEFFGVLEAGPNKEEGWHPLNVDSDGTSGLSTNGEIQLSKAAGEIKETEINGNRSRWIRTRLTDPIPTGRALPLIESVVLRVKAAAEGILADLAFHNETPQPAALSFNPFGVEPRIFDRFSLASKEAFSKRGADIVLDFKLDNVDLLASPVALFQEGVLRVFAHGAAGRLLEFPMVVNPAKSSVNPVGHGNPSAETRIVAGTTPAAVINDTKEKLGVFVCAQDRIKDDVQSIFLRYVPNRSKESDWKWYDLRAPTGTTLEFNPVAILDLQNKWRVFIVGGARVHYLQVEPGSGDVIGGWTKLGSPQHDIKVACTPFMAEANDQWIFATDETGKVWRHDGTDWNDLDFAAAKGSRPCAVLFTQGGTTRAKVFVRTPDGSLAYLERPGTGADSFRPPVSLDSDPSVVKMPDGSLKVYARGEDKRMWWIEPDAQNPAWSSTDNSVGIDLAGNPFAIFGDIKSANGNSKILSVFFATKTNSLVEKRSDFGVPSGALQAGPLDLLILQEPVDLSLEPIYIEIVAGPGKDDKRKIIYDLAQPNPTTLALLDKPLSAASTTATVYRLFKQIDNGAIQGIQGTPGSPPDSATLQNTGVVIVNGDFILVANQIQSIKAFASATYKVTLNQPWDPVPQINEPYVVLKQLTSLAVSSWNAQADAGRLIVLDQAASATNNIYNALSIVLQLNSGATAPLTISKYTGGTKLAELTQPINPLPAKQVNYGPIFEGWTQYQDAGRADLRPELSWEYWNGNGWVRLQVDDKTSNLLFDGEITFQVPESIANTEVAGQDNFWIRARIVGGDYGRELFEVIHDPDPNKPDQIRIKKDPIRPPLVKNLLISYSFGESIDPQICLTFNNLSYLDQTAANSTDDKNFAPFLSLPDTRPAVYFGFDQPFHSGPVRLYADARELDVDEQNKPVFAWTFETGNQWKSVTAEDETEAFTQPGIVTWSLPGVLDERERFGRELHWVRAVLEKGAWNGAPVLNGLFPNSAMASQFQTYRNEFIGPSDGTANQSFRLSHPAVMKGAELRIREVLTEDEQKQLIQAEGEDAIFTALDVRGQALERWVRWRQVEEFSKSTRASRHFRLDPAEGEIEFGDGIHGRIPPAGGDNIQVFTYQAGGGAAGNVRAGEVISLVTSVAGIDSVVNPIDAGGGSEAATPEDMLEIGPAEISHRFRAVTPEDFEWLAKEASRQVRKARCIHDWNAQGRREAGWVTVCIVPDSAAATPLPNVQLRRVVRRHLLRCADLNIANQDHIFVGAPEYVPVAVELTVFARSLDDVARAELNVKSELNRFLHPLTGGPEKKGWEFGRGLTVYDVCRLLEDIEEVDHLGPVTLHFSGKQSTARADVGPNALITTGEHIITTTVT